MKHLAMICGMATVVLAAISPFASASVYGVSSVNDLTPNAPLATSPTGHKTRYVTATGTASSFDLWYTDAQGSYVMQHVTGSYNGSTVTLGTPTAVTLNDGGYGWANATFAGYHVEMIKVGSTYHMLNNYSEYLTGTSPTSLTKQYTVSYTPSMGAGYPRNGVGGFIEDNGLFMAIQDTNFGCHVPVSTSTIGNSLWTQHGYITSAPYGEGGIFQEGAVSVLTPSGDLVKEGNNWLYFVPDEADGGLGLVDLGTDFTQGIANQDWVYDPDGDPSSGSAPILGTSAVPGLGGANLRDGFREAAFLPTGNAGEYLILYTADWTTASKQIGAAVIQVASESSTIPEPSTLAIWSLLALCGIGYGRRRRKT